MDGQNVDQDAHIYENVNPVAETPLETGAIDIDGDDPPAPTEPTPAEPKPSGEKSVDAEPAKPEKPAGEAKPASEGKPAEPPKPAWDSERQRRDQEISNVRKENRTLKEQLDVFKGEMDSMRELVSKQAGAAAAIADKPGATQGQADAASDLASLEAELDGELSKLEVGSDVPDIAAAMKSIAMRVLKAKAQSGATDPELATLRSKISDLEKEREERTEAEKVRAAEVERKAVEEAQARVTEDYEKHISKLKDDYGDHLHNDVLAAVAQSYKEDGIDENNPPPLPYAKRLFTYHYERLAKEKPAKTRESRPRGRTPRQDSGTGGTPAPREAKRIGTMDEVLADMEREGKFAPGYKGG